MDVVLKQQWIAALRSGTYRQGTGYLKDPTTGAYCCLGVLCSVHGVEPTFDRIDGYALGADYNLVRTLLSTDPNVINMFMNMNDGMGTYIDNPQTFAQIADYIDAHL